MDLIKYGMTISEVANSFSVNERTIRKYIERLFPDKMKNGIRTTIDEKEATIIKKSLEQNRHLDRVGQLPKTNLEKKLLIQQAIGFLNEEIEDLKQKVEYQSLKLEAAQPKIEFHDKVETSVNSISVAEFSNLLCKKGLKIGQNKLFKFFYLNGYLLKSDRPCQRAMDNGWFEIEKINFTDPGGFNRAIHKILVTGKGQIYFTKKLTKTTLTI